MTTEEVLAMLDDMAAQTRKTNGFFAGHVTHAYKWRTDGLRIV